MNTAPDANGRSPHFAARINGTSIQQMDQAAHSVQFRMPQLFELARPPLGLTQAAKAQ
jgi:hypothetical protein